VAAPITIASGKCSPDQHTNPTGSHAAPESSKQPARKTAAGSGKPTTRWEAIVFFLNFN